MKQVWWPLVILGGVLALSVMGVRAQPGGYGGGRGPGAGMNRIYNPQTVESITGAVVKVERAAPTGGMGQGVHLLVKTDKETLPVHLGPAWYLDNQELQIKPQDQVEVTGSRVTVDGQPALIASKVQDGGAVLRLRDEQGMPAWAGWRRGGAGSPGGMMSGPGGMGTNRMMNAMVQQHEKMMAKVEAMDADIEQKVQQMNQAQGQAKVEAMAGVINDLVKERKVMHQHMTEMHQHMMSHMHSMSEGVGGSAPGTSGESSGGGSSPETQ